MSDWNSLYPRERTEPICGWMWYHQHRADHSQADIDSLAIEVAVNGKLQARVQSGEKKDRGIVKEIVRINKEVDNETRQSSTQVGELPQVKKARTFG